MSQKPSVAQSPHTVPWALTPDNRKGSRRKPPRPRRSRYRRVGRPRAPHGGRPRGQEFRARLRRASLGPRRDYEATALAVPVDALAEPEPVNVRQISIGAAQVLDAVRPRDWIAVQSGIEAVRAAETAVNRDQPTLLAAEMTTALDRLGASAADLDAAAVSLAAIEAARIALDVALRYRPQPEVDLERFDLWARQLIVDSAAGDVDAVAGDVATLTWIRDRLALDTAGAQTIGDRLQFLEAAADAEDTEAVAAASEQLREFVAELH
jgi:hypothetical protein